MISTHGIQWPARISWVVLPFTLGPTLAEALADWSTPMRTTASAELWVGWAVGMAAAVIPGTVALVLLRIVALCAPLVGAAAVIDQSASPLGASFGVAAALLAFTPQMGEVAINAGSYGDEKRFMLRPPGALYLGPLPLAWLVFVLSLTAGPLLLSDRRWISGAFAIGLGAPVAAVLLRAFHALCQRWIVLVPAGMVLKDHHAVVDPVLFRRSEIELLHPAPKDTDAIDLTNHALGLVLELRLREKVPMVRVMPGRQPVQPGKVARLLFTPTRPGALLAAAAAHRICVDPAAVGRIDHQRAGDEEPGDQDMD